MSSRNAGVSTTVRHLSRILSAISLAAVASPALAQQTATVKFDRTGVPDTSIFAPLVFPTPSATRTASGAPGSHYWQNRADYDLHATLDTATKTISGEMTFRYTNNSPDTLTYIWMELEQNAFRKNSLSSEVYTQGSRWNPGDFEGGDHLTRVEQLVGSGNARKKVPITIREGETMMKVPLAEALAPGKAATLEMAWKFVVPEHGADRMGRDGSLYEIAQWYPRAAVYDDLRGWNNDPYVGQGEFYLDYGDYNVSVTVPAGYIVAGTGTLENSKDVLTPTELSRLDEAAKSDKVVRIITAAELKNGAARPAKSGMLTWRFRARDVRDAVFAASPDYQWDATTYKGAYAFGYYRPSAADLWTESADMARMSIQEYSERWFAYPWPQISVVEGPVSGMEYPMLAMEAHSNDKHDLYNVITHEIGHDWFPMIVGSNERMYMWQDEGFNTFINTFSEARRFPDVGDQMQRAAEERGEVEQAMKGNEDGPMMTPPDRISEPLLGIAAYIKPSVGLQLLRQEILGPGAFDDAFKTYITRWAYKHPAPADFFRTMEDASGHRLDWFWREWFVENVHFDQAVDGVRMLNTGDTNQVLVGYGNRARGVLPIRARFTFSDGSTQDFNYPAEVWSTNTVRYLRRYSFVGKKLVKVELDPDHRLVDIDRSNNVWTAP
ncbi:MAG: M1 family metallopeptidase [Gemmatimonadales bacterium]